jgi:hypothetical protein
MDQRRTRGEEEKGEASFLNSSVGVPGRSKAQESNRLHFECNNSKGKQECGFTDGEKPLKPT